MTTLLQTRPKPTMNVPVYVHFRNTAPKRQGDSIFVPVLFGPRRGYVRATWQSWQRLSDDQKNGKERVLINESNIEYVN